ncbi:hypothetical protein AX17_000854 [Amanita inopinata Kibby_2008]|nr:hypothetical protein AX17_000854 [Amanita inopinata Kibby_2008]
MVPHGKQKASLPNFDVLPNELYAHTPWLDLMPKKQCESFEVKLHDEIVAYERWSRPTSQELMARRAVFSCVEKVAKMRFRDAVVRLFGSCSTGLCLPTADIDIVILTREVVDDTEKKRAMFQLSSLFKAAQLTTAVRVNTRARVPVLKIVAEPEYGSFNIDVSINHTDGVQGKNIIMDYLSEMPALRPLVLIIKALVSQHGLNDPAIAGLGSYPIICLCIYFLKANPSQRPQSFLDNPLGTESLGILLTDFLWFFTNLSYTTLYVSARDGKLYPKEPSGWLNSANPNRLSVQCLVHPENDVSKPVGKRQVTEIIKVFKKALANILQSTPDDRTILGQFIGVDELVLRFRTQIRELVDSGVLKASSEMFLRSQSSRQRVDVPHSRNTASLTCSHLPLSSSSQCSLPPKPEFLSGVRRLYSSFRTQKR